MGGFKTDNECKEEIQKKMRTWDIQNVFLLVFPRKMKSKVQRVDNGKESENIAIQGAQMCDCHSGKGMSFSINPHAGIHNGYFYIIGNSHLSGKQRVFCDWKLPSGDSGFWSSHCAGNKY